MKNLNQLTELLEQVDFLKEQAAAVRELAERVRENELVISVIGQFKRGKSSLVNAMLGEELLPVAIIPLTTVVTEIRYGQSFRAEVLFADGARREIAWEELEDYCSEQKNKGNHKNVQTVRLWTPRHPFGEGIVLVDTPGVGSVHQHNTDSSYSYVEHSDAVIFLLSVDSPVSEIERDFLLKARDYAAKFFFAVNKADTVSPEDLETFLSFCRQVISEAMGTEITMEAVSARTGRGLPELVGRLKAELQSAGKNILEASVGKKLEILQGQALAKLELSIRAASLPAEELAEKLRRIEERQRELSGFAEEVQVLAKHRTELLVREIQEQFEEEIPHLKEEVRRTARSFYEANASLSAREFEGQLRAVLDRDLEERLSTLNQKGIACLETGYGRVVGLLTEKAMDAARFIAQLLREEFDLEYPVNESSFRVSDRSDFFLSIGSHGTLLLDVEAFARLLPRKLANTRFYRQSLDQADNDVERNTNNMLYNYRYKMQESLRVLCGELSEQINSMSGELCGLITHIRGNLDAAGEKGELQAQRLRELTEAIKEL